MNIQKLIADFTRDGITVSFYENPLGIAASGKRVMNIDMSNEKRTAGIGICYDNIFNHVIEEKLIELYRIVIK